jgi:hypothetical protein
VYLGRIKEGCNIVSDDFEENQGGYSEGGGREEGGYDKGLTTWWQYIAASAQNQEIIAHDCGLFVSPWAEDDGEGIMESDEQILGWIPFFLHTWVSEVTTAHTKCPPTQSVPLRTFTF